MATPLSTYELLHEQHTNLLLLESIGHGARGEEARRLTYAVNRIAATITDTPQ